MRPTQPRSAYPSRLKRSTTSTKRNPLAHKHRDPRYNSLHHNAMFWPAAAGSEAKRNSQIVERIDQLELEMNERL